MPFKLSIPRSSGGSLDLVVRENEALFILGANGSGKSALMQRLYSAHHGNARRISAHRQTWFPSESINISPEQKRQLDRAIKNNDQNPRSRWVEDHSEYRTTIAIYDLIDAENVRARAITKAVDEGQIPLAQALAKQEAPITTINALLRLSNIPITIAVRQNEEILARKDDGPDYNVAQLSDGERNALLIAANILTANSGTLFVIDEPERHLHRSIISPLLTLLVAQRPDCAFIISTHDVMLPLDNPRSQTLLLRGCTFSGGSVSSWDVDLIAPGTNIDDELKKDILGARRKLLFVEGSERSLDKPLYGLAFPNVSVVAKSSSRDVEHAVSGIRDAHDLHWVHAFGIVDNDGKAQVDVDRLKSKGVYAVSVFSVESIYYHPEIQRNVAERHAAVTGEDAPTRLSNAHAAAIAAIRQNAQRMCERAVEKTLRAEMFGHLPGRDEIAAAKPVAISLDIPAVVESERHRLEAALDAGNLTEIVARYPVRETPALNEIAKKLGFQDREQYEGAVRKLLMDDKDILTFVRSLFGTLSADILAA